MTLGDLYPDVRLYSEVETINMTRGRGGSGRDIWGEGGKVGGGSGRIIINPKCNSFFRAGDWDQLEGVQKP